MLLRRRTYLLSFPVPASSRFPQFPRGELDRTGRRWPVLDGLPRRRWRVPAQIFARSYRVQLVGIARRRRSGVGSTRGSGNSVQFVLLFPLLFVRFAGRGDQGGGEHRSFVRFLDRGPRGGSRSHDRGGAVELLDANDRMEMAGGVLASAGSRPSWFVRGGLWRLRSGTVPLRS